MATFEPEGCLQLVRSVVHPVAMERGDPPSTLSMFANSGEHSREQTWVFGAIFSWALAVEFDLSVRSEFADALEFFAVENSGRLGVPLVALVLAGEKYPTFLKSEDCGFIRDAIATELSQLGATLEEFRQASFYVNFSAPHWVAILTGLVRSHEESQVLKGWPWRRRALGDAPSPEDSETNRDRRLARLMLRHFVEAGQCDPVAREVFQAAISWMLQAEPDAPDVTANYEVLELLQTAGMA